MNNIIEVSTFYYLLHPYRTFLVTCCDAEGKANIITVAWLMPVSAKPPLLIVSIRPNRHSYHYIKATREFVVNVAQYEIAQQALYCGRRSGRDVDKFAATKLTPAPARHVASPIIEECIAHLECRVVQEVEAGDHQLFIGEVLAAYTNEEFVDKDGLYDLSRVHPLLHIGRDRFTSTRAEFVEPSLSE